MNVVPTKPGVWMDNAPLISEVDFNQWSLRLPTDGYRSPEEARKETENLWMRVWQMAGRAEEIPNAGDWKIHNIEDQSFLIVRGKDGQIRGFVNACRHRGNRICEGKGHSARFTCRYHNWTYGLDGKCLAVAHPDFDGPLNDFVAPKEDLGLLPISVECFAGFIFMNPDKDAAPLAEFLGPAKDVIDAYRIEEFVAVGVNVREELACNWKVVIDAFGESYHVQGVHQELVGVSDTSRERFQSFGYHSSATVPFGADSPDDPEAELQAILGVPSQQFPIYADILPRFAEVAQTCRDENGKLALPEGVSPKKLFRQTIREQLTSQGYDVSKLTDTQMTDYQYWVLFPNVYLQICVGDAHIILSEPHPSGDHNRCIWHVIYMRWMPPELRSANTEPVTIMSAGEHYPYHWVLEQDFEQMALQQIGLRNHLNKEMWLTKSEPRVAHFHTVLNRWLEKNNGQHSS